MDLEIVMKKLEDFFAGETHEAFESYEFHLRKQEPTESIKAYVVVLRQLAKIRNFGQLRDRLMREHVVVGVRDDSIREKLLAYKQLTLDRCLQIERAYCCETETYLHHRIFQYNIPRWDNTLREL